MHGRSGTGWRGAVNRCGGVGANLSEKTGERRGRCPGMLVSDGARAAVGVEHLHTKEALPEP